MVSKRIETGNRGYWVDVAATFSHSIVGIKIRQKTILN